MSKILCIYHGYCDDGFAAALAVKYRLKEDVEFHPGVYQNPPPDVDGRDVVMVDFSYKRPVLEQMGAKANSILILDHHKTAAEDLQPFAITECGNGRLSWTDVPGMWRDFDELSKPKIAALFDMNRSGATIAWDVFCGDGVIKERPEFFNYIEDRDLWRKALPKGDEFTIALRSHPQDFAVWDRFVRDPHLLFADGIAIQRYYRLRCEELKRSAYLAQLASVPSEPPFATADEPICAIANAPYFAASEVAGELCATNGAMYGASYFEVSSGKFQYSLRSRGDFDVSEIAKRFGGGGHKNAAGFSSTGIVHIKH